MNLKAFNFKYQKYIKYTGKAVFSILFTLITCIPVFAKSNTVVAPVLISAKVDSATITMGERTVVRVEIVKNGHAGNFLMPLDKNGQNVSQEGGDNKMSIAGIEIRQATADSTDLGNNRIQVDYQFLIQPFNPGDYTLPPFKFALNGDTLTSNVVSLKILEPEIPQEMRDSLLINPLRPPMSIKAEWYDWIPSWFSSYWYLWLIGIILAALGAAAYILYKKNGKLIFTPKKVIPPYQLAKKRLDELKKKRLYEKGHNKAYYTELTDILRQYLGGRFRIYALEMTSTQILDALKNNPETKPFVTELREMFTVADFVKFAKQDSTVTENIKSFNAVEKFIDDTKPVETEEKTENNKK